MPLEAHLIEKFKDTHEFNPHNILPDGAWLDSNQNLWVADGNNDRVVRLSDGYVKQTHSRHPTNVAVDNDIIIASSRNLDHNCDIFYPGGNRVNLKDIKDVTIADGRPVVLLDPMFEGQRGVYEVNDNLNLNPLHSGRAGQYGPVIVREHFEHIASSGSDIYFIGNYAAQPQGDTSIIFEDNFNLYRLRDGEVEVVRDLGDNLGFLQDMDVDGETIFMLSELEDNPLMAGPIAGELQPVRFIGDNPLSVSPNYASGISVRTFEDHTLMGLVTNYYVAMFELKETGE